MEEIVISKLVFHTNYLKKMFVNINETTRIFTISRSNSNGIIHQIFRIIYTGNFWPCALEFKLQSLCKKTTFSRESVDSMNSDKLQ